MRRSSSRSRRIGRSGRSPSWWKDRRTKEAGPAGAAGDDHRSQRRDPRDLAAHRRALRQPSRDDRHRRGRAQAEAGLPRLDEEQVAKRLVGGKAVRLSRPPAHAARATRRQRARQSRACISSPPSAGATRWDAPPRRFWAASMWTGMGSPVSSVTSTSGSAPTHPPCAFRSTFACRRWCATSFPRPRTSSALSARAGS